VALYAYLDAKPGAQKTPLDTGPSPVKKALKKAKGGNKEPNITLNRHCVTCSEDK